jgi:hypothetical protein
VAKAQAWNRFTTGPNNKQQAMTNNKQQAMTRRKHTNSAKRCLGGARPHARTMAATNCRATIYHATTCDMDTRYSGEATCRGKRPAVQGHRRRPVDNLNYFSRGHISALLLWDLLGCQFNNGGEYGITIRLHGLGHRRMDQGAARHSCKFLLDNDVHRYGYGYQGECRRGYFPDHVSSNVGTWSMDQNLFFDGGQRPGTRNDRLQMQRSYRSSVQVYSKVDQGRRKMAGREAGEKRGLSETQSFKIVSTSNLGEQSPRFFCAWKMDNRIKEQATSHKR